MNKLSLTWWTMKSKGQCKIKGICDSPMSCCNCWHLTLESSLFLLETLWYAGFLSCGVVFLALELEEIFSIWRNEKEVEKWILNGIFPGDKDSQQSGRDGLVPGVCKVTEYPHCLRFGDKLRIISSVYKVISSCTFTLESNSLSLHNRSPRNLFPTLQLAGLSLLLLEPVLSSPAAVKAEQFPQKKKKKQFHQFSLGVSQTVENQKVTLYRANFHNSAVP